MNQLLFPRKTLPQHKFVHLRSFSLHFLWKMPNKTSLICEMPKVPLVIRLRLWYHASKLKQEENP